jgi:integrase
VSAADALAGRRERTLLAWPSVHRMAELLAARCREPSWVRTSVASLERFRTLTGHTDLEALLERARAEPAAAERALGAFASALAGATASQVAGLAMGPKIWFRVNGVMVPWRPLPGVPAPPPLWGAEPAALDRLVLLALIGSGLRLAELLRLRVGDVGSLDMLGRVIPEVDAEPLAVQHTPRRGRAGERITFLTYQARQVLLADLTRRANAGQSIGREAPLLARRDGSAATRASVARARCLNAALIRSGNAINVELCRTTGDFFRAWGVPGSRFVGPEELDIEEEP